VETVENLFCFCQALCRLRLKHLRSPFIDDLTEISEINLKNISAFVKGGADLVLVQEPWVVGGKVAGLGINEYKLMLDPKEGKIRTCILAKRLLSIFLLRNYSNGDNTAVSLELQSGSIGLLGL